MLDLDFKPEDLIPMPAIMTQARDNAMRSVMDNQEREIKEALDAAGMPTGYTMLDVAARCTLVPSGRSAVKTLYFDGNPILEIQPIEFGEFTRKGESYVQTITQKFRRL